LDEENKVYDTSHNIFWMKKNKVYDTSHNIFWMKKNKVYADLGQQNGFGPMILMHIIRASPPKCFSHPSFSYSLFSNPTHKTEIGTASTYMVGDC
jgi:hypothetical protein